MDMEGSGIKGLNDGLFTERGTSRLIAPLLNDINKAVSSETALINPHTSSVQSFFYLDTQASGLIAPLLNDINKAVSSEAALLPFFEFKRDNATALLARMLKRRKVRNAEGIVIPTPGDKLKKEKEETKALYAAQKSARIKARKLPISKEKPYRADKGKFAPIQQPRGKR